MPVTSFMDRADAHPSAAWFATTQWTVVLAAKERHSTAAAAALETLCHAYWPPLYAFIRHQGHGPAEAQDLTQEFFSRLLEKNYLGHLNHQQGRFRSFLLAFVKHFLSDERDKERAQKRGGGRVPISLDDARVEEEGWLEPCDQRDPEQLFEQRWAHAVLAQAVRRLEGEYTSEGKGELFAQMKDIQPGQRGERSYAELAAGLGMSATAFKSAIHRMRQRYSRCLREVIAHTVTSPEEIDDEIRHLLAVLSK